MGLVTAKLVLRNPRHPRLAPVKVKALADSGAVHLCIPEKVRARLKLEAIDEKTVVLADGSRRTVSYVGPVEVRFKNRVGFTGAAKNSFSERAASARPAPARPDSASVARP